MNLELKSFALKAMSQSGEGEAVIVVKHILDTDGDWFEDGAVGEQTIQILRGHDWSQGISLGKGKTFETKHDVRVLFKLNTALPEGEALRQYLLFDLSEGDRPLSEWSIGFRVNPGGSRQDTKDGRSARVFQRLEDGSPGLFLKEVSIVLAGAVPGTHTVSAKGDDQLAALQAVISTQQRLIAVLKHQLADRASQKGREVDRELYRGAMSKLVKIDRALAGRARRL